MRNCVESNSPSALFLHETKTGDNSSFEVSIAGGSDWPDYFLRFLLSR